MNKLPSNLTLTILGVILFISIAFVAAAIGVHRIVLASSTLLLLGPIFAFANYKLLSLKKAVARFGLGTQYEKTIKFDHIRKMNIIHLEMSEQLLIRDYLIYQALLDFLGGFFVAWMCFVLFIIW